MTISADYHVHTEYSGDAHTTMREQILSAAGKGLDCLCITDHLDLDFPYAIYPDLDPHAFDFDIDAAYREFCLLKDEFSDRIELHFGLEAGLLPHLDSAYRKILADHPQIEYVIGSTHLCRMRRDAANEYVDPYYPPFFAENGETDGLRLYFETALESVRACSFFDSYGHLDYVVRYCPDKDMHYRYADYADLIDPLLEILIERDQALEFNTAAWRKGCLEGNPCTDILKRYREMGGTKVTVGSDAHIGRDIGSGFEKAAELLAACGFENYYIYKNREPFRVSL